MMTYKLTYEMGLEDGVEMIGLWEDGKLEVYPEAIRYLVSLRLKDGLSEYLRGCLDAWEDKFGGAS